MNPCKTCKTPTNGNFCSNCGHPTEITKIDGRYIVNEFTEVLSANKGLLYTLKNMLIRPGKSVRQYIAEDRSLYVKPTTFIVVTALIYTVINYCFPFYVPYTEELDGSTVGLINNWLVENIGYSNLIVGFFVAFVIRLFFRKSGYNLFEIFTLICFVSGIGTLIMSVGAILQAVLPLNVMNFILVIGSAHMIWAIGQFFGRGYLKAFLSYVVCVLMISILISIGGTLVDVFLR